MTETEHDSTPQEISNAEVADSHAPAHVEEKSIDQAVERALEEATNGYRPG